MEYYSNEQCFLEELLSVKEAEYHPNHDFNAVNLDYFAGGISSIPLNTCCFEDFSLPIDLAFNFSSFAPFGEGLSPPEFAEDSPSANINAPSVPFDFQLDYCYSNPIVEDYGKDAEIFGNVVQSVDVGAPCKDEPLPEMPAFNIGFCPENEKKKKIHGQPSKNLMAERRRRKRLNDRLSMLRSVVPKISKMDRTSILGDTIEYMKELLERVHSLHEEMDEQSNEFGGYMSTVRNNENLVRNSPKFDVERENGDTRIKICCAMKPGLLLSTMTTLEELGLEIQHCVISCFNDFAFQASCSQREIIEAEDIKQALFRKAGYGGRCL